MRNDDCRNARRETDANSKRCTSIPENHHHTHRTRRQLASPPIIVRRSIFAAKHRPSTLSTRTRFTETPLRNGAVFSPTRISHQSVPPAWNKQCRAAGLQPGTACSEAVAQLWWLRSPCGKKCGLAPTKVQCYHGRKPESPRFMVISLSNNDLSSGIRRQEPTRPGRRGGVDHQRRCTNASYWRERQLATQVRR